MNYLFFMLHVNIISILYIYIVHIVYHNIIKAPTILIDALTLYYFIFL